MAFRGENNMKKVKEEKVAPAEYFRLVKTERNMFKVEVITVENGKVTSTNEDEPTYLPIAFDKMRRKTGEQFFKAVQAEHDGT